MTIDLSAPTSWHQLTDHQLHTLFALIAMGLSSPEVKTLCLLKWNNITVLGSTNRRGEYWVKVQKATIKLTSSQLEAATHPLSFIDTIPSTPVRLSKIGRHKALPADFEGVPFESYLVCDNLFQGYLHTQSIPILKDLLAILYGSKVHADEPACIMAFYWFASLKSLFAHRFPHFYVPIGEAADEDMLQSQSLHQKLTAAVNAQIRALTGGDVTKEPFVLKMDTHRALTELDAKAREAQELQKSSSSSRAVRFGS